MATEKEEVVLQFKIEQGDALTEMERMKKLILQTKQEQKELNDAYKKGNITLDEFVKEGVRLEANLRRQQSSYNNVQKSVTGVKTQLDKLIDSNQKISKDLQNTSQKFQDVASQINVAGVNVGSLTTKLSSFSNPATAAVTVVSALGAAYARSTIGAKDLAFAQNQLSEATTIVTNRFASLFSSAEDGEGALTKLLNLALQVGGNTLTGRGLALLGFDINQIAKESKELALIAEQLEDLQRTEVELRTTANDRLADNQELLSDIQSDQTKYNDKIDKTNEIITNIRRSQEEVRSNLEEQLALVNTRLESDSANEDILDAQLAIKKEIAALDKDSEKRVQAIVRLQQNLNEAENKKLRDAEKNRFGKLQIVPEFQQGDALQQQQDNIDFINNYEINSNDTKLKEIREASEVTEEEITDFKNQEAKKRQRITEQQTRAELNAYAAVAGAISGIFEEGSDLQKAFALTSIAVDTAEAIAGLTSASEQNPGNAYTFGAAGIAQYASGIVRILANIASAKQYLSAAAGGGDFLTKGPAMLLVGDNPGGVERVTVEPLSGKGKTVVNANSNLIAMAGGGSLTTGVDPGAIFATQQLSAEVNNNRMMARNIAKQMASMPAPVVSVKEFNRVSNKVKVKENIARANKG